ncbi:hypothetical protein RUM43_002581 [Polyplax serrata]|uniref:Uncharacterized protein n=1 Tax=Polyplax serrata TaxID=468196 RepID=A0AAN8P2F1_POLSC
MECKVRCSGVPDGDEGGRVACCAPEKRREEQKSVRFAEIQEIWRKKTTEQFNSELMVAVLSQRSGWGNRPPYFNFKFRLLLSPGRELYLNAYVYVGVYSLVGGTTRM